MVTGLEIGRKAAQILDEKLASIEDLGERIAVIGREIDGRIAFSTSLGIEDQVILHAIAGARADIDVFTLDTGRHFPETLDTLERSELRYRKRIRVVAPEREDVEALVARDGIFGFRGSVEARKSCCEVRKVLPLKRALKGASGWITGLRRSQSNDRTNVAFASWDSDNDLIKINPIADWSLDQVDAFVSEHKIPVNSLHAKGFPSIGCQPCTRAIEPGEDIRAGRWWWENEDGKECGLHVGAATKGGVHERAD